MTKHMPAAMFEADIATITPVAQAMAPASGHVFDLPPVLHGLTVACYFGFLGVMAATLGNPEMILPFVVFFLFVTAAFTVPALWARIAPPDGRAQSWVDFRREGIQCETGHMTSRAAIGQVLILPVLILLWAVIVSVIVAFV
jgi:hypothetical protein